MPQPKRQTSRSSSARKSGSSAGAKKGTSAAKKSTGSAKKRASAAKKAPARKAAPRKAASSAARKTSSASSRSTSGPADDARRNVQAAIETLTHGMLLTRERVQEVLDDAVTRGRITPHDANTLGADLFKLGRKQTDELRKQAEALRADIEQLLGRAGDELERRAGDARRRAMRSGGGDRALREVDRARRAAKLGRFPILNYEDLTAGQITDRLGDLSPAELRKVRDHERRNANRKSVLSAIEKALG